MLLRKLNCMVACLESGAWLGNTLPWSKSQQASHQRVTPDGSWCSTWPSGLWGTQRLSAMAVEWGGGRASSPTCRWGGDPQGSPARDATWGGYAMAVEGSGGRASVNPLRWDSEGRGGGATKRHGCARRRGATRRGCPTVAGGYGGEDKVRELSKCSWGEILRFFHN
jgi:hypothetical protein